MAGEADRKKSRDKIRRQRNGAMFRVFTGTGTPEDAKVARETIAAICKVNDRLNTTGGIDAIIEMAKREGKREAWLDIAEAITVGQREQDELEWDTLADSEGRNDSWHDVGRTDADADGTGG